MNVERLPRAEPLPILARHQRKETGVMRGVRKPAAQTWDGSTIYDWGPSEWRNGRLRTAGAWVNDFEDDPIEGSSVVSDEDVWWRVRCLDGSVPPTEALLPNIIPVSVDDDDLEIINVNQCTDQDGMLPSYPELFSSNPIILSADCVQERNTCGTKRKDKIKEPRHCKRRKLIELPRMELDMPSYNAAF